MTNMIRTVVRYLVRFAILWFVDALSLLFTSWVLPGMNLSPVGDTQVLTGCFSAHDC
jgi:hypothetical protein